MTETTNAPKVFISYDTHDPLSTRTAQWIETQVREVAEVIIPLDVWSLGSWHAYLHTLMQSVQYILVVLSSSYVQSSRPLVQSQRQLVLAMDESRLIVALVEEDDTLLREEASLQHATRVDLRSVVPSGQATRKAGQALVQALVQEGERM
ncbi:MAG: hypothetical protein NVSMB49_23710 [Ktedonobacteraceae bacterium]